MQKSKQRNKKLLHHEITFIIIIIRFIVFAVKSSVTRVFYRETKILCLKNISRILLWAFVFSGKAKTNEGKVS